MPVSPNSGPPPDHWGELLANARTPEFETALNLWGNHLYLAQGKSAGGYTTLGEITSNGGMLWLHGLHGYCGFRWFPDGSLHRYVIQSNGKLKEYRIETVKGEIIYTSPDPFSGSTAGDLFMRRARTKKPFHVTDKATLALLGWNNWQTLNVTWFYDDTGGVSFGVLPDGSKVVYPLNLTPEGPVSVDAYNSIDPYWGNKPWKYISPYAAVKRFNQYIPDYNGNVLPQAPFGKNYHDSAGTAAIPIWTSSEYFTNLTITDEKIKSLPGSGIAFIYYTLLQTKMMDGCPDYIPTKGISNGLMWGGDVYRNEMDIRMRIYNLRPDLHFTTGPKGEKIVGLVDPLIIPIYNGMKCKESIWATVGLAVALSLFTAGVGAILPVLGTLTELAQMGNAVANMFAAQEGVQRALELKNEISGGIAGILKETKLTIPTPTVTKTPAPVTGTVAPVTGTVASAPSSSSKSLAIPAVLLLLLLL